LFFQDYKEYCERKSSVSGVFEFMEDSVANNYMLSDSLEEATFSVNGDHIYFNGNNLINMGQFYIDNHQVNLCGSYMFFEDLSSSSTYVYYGD